MKDMQQELNHKYYKKRYELLKSQGLCVLCGVFEATVGRVHCEACGKKQSAYITKQYHEKSDFERKIIKEKSVLRYKKLKAAGLCTACAKQPITKASYLCEECYEKRRIQKENRNIKKFS